MFPTLHSYQFWRNPDNLELTNHFTKSEHMQVSVFHNHRLLFNPITYQTLECKIRYRRLLRLSFNNRFLSYGWLLVLFNSDELSKKRIPIIQSQRISERLQPAELLS